MLPASPIHHLLSPPNAVLPLLVPLPPGSAGWAVATAPRHQQPPRLLAPGSGVFLPPPGSGNSSPPQLLPATSTEVGSSVETTSHSKMENGSINPSVKGRLDGKMEKPDCSGNMDGTGGGREMAKEEHPHSTPAGTA
ncbi:hypothetical protein Nepgr_028122 [Nepenthes gracilis]|uniref:Uncharacterized protein n=1 Tax=Nepenthes gracilis TaxID=150966 RepID=A0AAD3Y3T2_NEPGR|nr:hypothetical protein Nepgr_028122 [Nepenthes gracilis]